MKHITRLIISFMLALTMVSVYLPVYAAGTSDIIVEAENASPVYSSGWNSGYSTKKGSGSTGHGYFSFVQSTNISSPAQTVAFSLGSISAGIYDIYVMSKDNTDRAIFQFQMDGTSFGDPVDMYKSGTGTFVEHKIGSVTLSTTATHTLTAVLSGKNTANTTNKYGGTFDYFRLVKTADISQPTQESATIWNNEETLFSTTGTWTSVAKIGQDGSASLAASDTSATATWADYPAKTGNFIVYYWNPAVQNGETRATACLDISTQDGTWRANIDTSKEAGTWVKAMTLTASAGTMMTASMHAVSNGTVYADALKFVETTDKADAQYTPGTGTSTEPAVVVNQIGYDTGSSKQATAVNIADGTAFQLINTNTNAVVYTGTVKAAYGDTVTGGIIDFTDFNTAGSYKLSCMGADSYTFSIGEDLMYKNSVKQALQFMIETRQDYVVGQSTGYAWRDSHQFSFELNGLVLQYMANPALYNNLTGGVTDASKCVYPELRTQGATEPDIVWLMKFAAMRYYDLAANKNIHLHMLIKEQLAYFLYIYPQISQWVDHDFYVKVRDLTITQWGYSDCNKQWYPVRGTNHNLYNVQTVFGGLKGSQPPGHSIIPNLMMYEVAKRDGLDQGQINKFFGAAADNCSYLINSVDLTDPYYDKGQRMSEHITMEAMAYFLEMYPEQAPAGLKDKITAWAVANTDRTDNLWGIRMCVAPSDLSKGYTYHTGSNAGKAVTSTFWTGAAYAIKDGQNPAPKDEPGNQAGLEAISFAAARVLDDTTLDNKLHVMGVSAIDDLMGRNPTGRAAFYNFTRDFSGADLGWWTEPTGGFGKLYNCTAVIDANAPEATYPYAPENYKSGYTEGWVAYNSAWNDSLAYLSSEDTSITADKSGNVGDAANVVLTAPIGLDASKIETGTVQVTDPITNEVTDVTVTENAADSTQFTGTVTLPNAPYVDVSYGTGLFKQSVRITVSNYVNVPVSSVTLDKTEMSLEAGAKGTLTASVLPDNATDTTVTYVSDNTSVATVDASGNVTAVAKGTAHITAVSTADSTKKDVCTITVTEPVPTGLVVKATSAINAGDTGNISVTGIVYSNGETKTENIPTDVQYQSSAMDVIMTATDGTLTAFKAGTATITATATVDGVSISGTADVKVLNETTYAFRTLYDAGKSTVSSGGKETAINDNSIVLDGTKARVKLTSTTGGKIIYHLGNVQAGSYKVTLKSKYYTGYGKWAFTMNGASFSSPINFNDGTRNGSYYDIPLGTYTMAADGTLDFGFVSQNGGGLVPYSLTLERVLSPASENPITVTAYEGPYDGKPHTISATAEKAGSILFYSTVEPSKATAADWQLDAPVWTDATEAKTVYVKAVNANYEDNFKQATVTITKAAATENAITAVGTSGVYDGKEHSITASAPQQGTVLYYSTVDPSSASSEDWKQDAPVFTDAGTYTVYVKAVNPNYEDSTANADVIIAKAPAADNSITAAGYLGTYDGKAHTIHASAAISSSVLYYSTSASSNDWSTTAPSWTDAVDDKTVYVKAVNPNYEDSTANAKVTIHKADAPAPAAVESLYITSNAITVKEAAVKAEYGTAEYRINGGTWQSGPVFNDLNAATAYTVEARYHGSADYNASKTSSTVITTLNYKIIEGADQTVEWKATATEPAVFRSDAPLSRFKEVRVDGSVVEPKYYTASGNTTITLSADYLATLAIGEHRMQMVSTDGSASTIFTIARAVNKTPITAANNTENTPKTNIPNTADQSNIATNVLLFLLSLTCAAAAFLYRRKVSQ